MPSLTPELSPEQWAEIELRYKAGRESVRAIAASYGKTEATIRKRATKLGWERDLTQTVQARARADLLAQPTVTKRAEFVGRRTERQIIAEAADNIGGVVRSHRDATARGLRMAIQALEDLEADAAKTKPELSLGARAMVLDKIATATAKFTTTQREAWGLNDRKPGDDLREMTEAQLQERLKRLEDSLAKLDG